MRRLHFTFILVAIVSACFVGVARNAASPTIPLCPGLTIVTAVSQQDGDYESIKTVQSVTAAVKDALVKHYGIDVAGLVTAGFGRSQPKDTNETLEGRARNRRVELVRQP